MNRLVWRVWVAAACALATPCVAQQKAALIIVERMGPAVLVKAAGGSVHIPSKALTTVSARSSLQLEWQMVIDSSLQVVFDDPVGASGVFDDPWFRYQSNMKMRALGAVKAFEVRVLTFNVWNEFTGTLTFTQLEDLAAGQRKAFERVWGIFGESQLRAHLRSIAYVANVMLADGTVIAADPALVLKAAKVIQSNITIQDLQPKTEPIPLAARRA